jgi:hypothetical protein
MSRPGRSVPEWTLLLLVATVLCFAALPISASSAAPVTGTAAQVTLDSITPATVTPSDTVRVTGRIVNTGSTTLSGVRVSLLSQQAPLTTRSQVTTWMETPSAAVDAPERAATTVTGTIPPQQSATFTLTVPATDLDLTATERSFGARGAGIEVSAGSRDDRISLAVQRTFLVWTPDVSYSPTNLTVLTPVTSTVPQADAAFPETDLLETMDAGGRLDDLLRAAADPAITWMLDPSLVTAAQEAATGTPSEKTTSTTAAVSGTGGATNGDTDDASATTGTTEDTSSPTTSVPSPSTGADATSRWLNLLVEGLAGREAVALPFGDCDVTTLAHTGTVDLMTLAEELSGTAIEPVLGQRLRTDVTLPADGLVDQDTLAMLSDTGSTSVVLSADAQPLTEDLTYTPSGRSTVPVTERPALRGLLYDPALSAEFAATGSDSAAVATQQLMADLATLAAEHPNDSRSVLAVTPRDWTPDPTGVLSATEALHSASSWLRLTPLSSLESAAVPAVTRAEPQYPNAARAAELPFTAVAPVVTTLDELDRFAPALTEPEPVITPMNRTAALLTSVRWRGEPEKQAEARNGFATQVQTLYDRVTILPSGPKILVSRSLSPMLVTLENQLDQPVHVILQLRPRTGRLQVPHTVGVTLDAHRRQTVRVQVRAVANGDVQVEAILLTTEKQVLGTADPITVRVHSDWENRALAVSGGFLLILVVVGLIRGVRNGRVRVPLEEVPDADEEVVRRESQPKAARPGPEPDDRGADEDAPAPRKPADGDDSDEEGTARSTPETPRTSS